MNNNDKRIKTRLTKNTIHEVHIQPTIINIPNYSSFFYTFDTAEPISIGRLQEDYMESTEVIKDGYLLLSYDGIHLSPATEFITNVKRLIDLYLHIMKGNQLLNSVSIIHLNICLNNIIIKDGELPLLQGFEHAVFKATPSNMIVLPIECRAIKYMINHKLSSISVSNVLDICENKDEEVFLTTYINKPNQYILDSLLQYSNTWNSYSLNVLILKLLNDFNPNPFIKKWKQLIKQGLTVFNRGTPEYFIEQTLQLMRSAEFADLTATPASRSTTTRL